MIVGKRGFPHVSNAPRLKPALLNPGTTGEKSAKSVTWAPRLADTRVFSKSAPATAVRDMHDAGSKAILRSATWSPSGSPRGDGVQPTSSTLEEQRKSAFRKEFADPHSTRTRTRAADVGRQLAPLTRTTSELPVLDRAVTRFKATGVPSPIDVVSQMKRADGRILETRMPVSVSLDSWGKVQFREEDPAVSAASVSRMVSAMQRAPAPRQVSQWAGFLERKGSGYDLAPLIHMAEMCDASPGTCVVVMIRIPDYAGPGKDHHIPVIVSSDKTGAVHIDVVDGGAGGEGSPAQAAADTLGRQLAESGVLDVKPTCTAVGANSRLADDLAPYSEYQDPFCSHVIDDLKNSRQDISVASFLKSWTWKGLSF